MNNNKKKHTEYDIHTYRKLNKTYNVPGHDENVEIEQRMGHVINFIGVYGDTMQCFDFD